MCSKNKSSLEKKIYWVVMIFLLAATIVFWNKVEVHTIGFKLAMIAVIVYHFNTHQMVKAIDHWKARYSNTLNTLVEDPNEKKEAK